MRGGSGCSGVRPLALGDTHAGQRRPSLTRRASRTRPPVILPGSRARGRALRRLPRRGSSPELAGRPVPTGAPAASEVRAQTWGTGRPTARRAGSGCRPAGAATASSSGRPDAADAAARPGGSGDRRRVARDDGASRHGPRPAPRRRHRLRRQRRVDRQIRSVNARSPRRRRKWPLFLSVDQEGGDRRARQGRRDPLPDLHERRGRRPSRYDAGGRAASGAELRGLGFDVVFAPDADVTSGPGRPHHRLPLGRCRPRR